MLSNNPDCRFLEVAVEHRWVVVDEEAAADSIEDIVAVAGTAAADSTVVGVAAVGDQTLFDPGLQRSNLELH